MSDSRSPADGGTWSNLHEGISRRLIDKLRAIDPVGADAAEASLFPYRRREAVRSAARIISCTVERKPEEPT